MIAYLAVTDKDKKTTYRWHIVWNLTLFLAAQREQHAKEKSTVAVCTEEDYREARWPNYKRPEAA